MRIKQFVGAVGGRPKLAYYFVGTTYGLSQMDGRKIGKGLVYLDPHFVQAKCYNLAKEYEDEAKKFHL